MSQPESATPPGEASVRPVDVDGVVAVRIGTALWAVAFLALLPFTDTLREDDRLWWLGTCAAGVALGALGLVYTTLRRRRSAH
jgi:hypothetical protein